MAYSAKYGKSQSTVEEFNKRKSLFQEADKFILSYPTSNFTMAHNKYSDWTPEEKKKLLGALPL